MSLRILLPSLFVVGFASPAPASNRNGTRKAAASASAITPVWLGNPTVRISRDTHATGISAESFVYDSWVRQRAALREMSFQVWAPGYSDRTNPDLWKQLDTKIHFRFAGEQRYRTSYVSFSGSVGNNAQYTLPLGGFDPFAWPPTTDVPTTTGADGRKSATMHFYFTVNGKKLLRTDGTSFSGVYTE